MVHAGGSGPGTQTRVDAQPATPGGERAGVGMPSDGGLERGAPVGAGTAGRRPSGQPIITIPRISLDERFGRILLSAVLAILLWFYVISLENPERQTVFRGLAIEVRGLDSTLRIINQNQLPVVDAIVQAPENLMGTIRQSDIHPYIDLSGLDAGVHTVPVHVDRTGIPEGANISVRPPTVQVQLEVQASRRFPVTVKINGTPAFGYGIEPAQVDPEEVTVTGSRDAVGRVAEVVVLVDVDQKAGTQQGLVAPIALDANGVRVEDVAFSPDRVQVVVPIKLLFSYKVVPVTVPVLGQPAAGYVVSSVVYTPTTVTVCCSPGLLEPLGSVETHPVSITGTTTTVITSTELILPPGVDLYPGQSKSVEVMVGIEAQLTTWQLSVPVVVEGASPDMGAVVSPNRVDLTLSGTFVQLQALKPTDVRAVVNVQGRGPGTYEVQPQITLPPGITLSEVRPNRVTVTLIGPTPAPPTPTATVTATPTSTPSPTSTQPPAQPTGTPPPATPAPTRSPEAEAVPRVVLVRPLAGP